MSGTRKGVRLFDDRHIGLGLASRIGPIKRFPRPRSLSNYFGLTPGCRNSGNAKKRLGALRAGILECQNPSEGGFDL